MAIPDESDFSCLHPNARVKSDGGNQAVVCNSCDKIVTHLRGDVTRVAELEAVIEKVRRHAISGANIGQPEPHDGFEEGLDHGVAIEAEATLRILATAPSVVLGEHDREVAAQALEAFADKWANWVFTDGAQIRGGAAYRARCEAAAIRNGEHA